MLRGSARSTSSTRRSRRGSSSPNVATGLENIGDEEAWLINYPDPPYDPDLKDEQVEYTQAELEAGVVK